MVDDQTGTGYNGIGYTCDLFDGDFFFLSVRYNYLCDGMNVQMNSVWSDPLHRIFLTSLHLEDGYLDHRSGGGGGVARHASVAMGRWSYDFIHHADVSSQTASCNTAPMQEWGGATEQ